MLACILDRSESQLHPNTSNACFRAVVVVLFCFRHIFYWSCFEIVSIHPFSVPASFQFWVAGVCWSLSQHSRGEGRGRIGCQPTSGLTLKDRHSLSHTPKVNLDWSIHLTSMSLDCGRKPECPEKTHTCTQGEHANSTQKGRSRDSKPQTFLLFEWSGYLAF